MICWLATALLCLPAYQVHACNVTCTEIRYIISCCVDILYCWCTVVIDSADWSIISANWEHKSGSQVLQYSSNSPSTAATYCSSAWLHWSEITTALPSCEQNTKLCVFKSAYNSLLFFLYSLIFVHRPYIYQLMWLSLLVWAQKAGHVDSSDLSYLWFRFIVVFVFV